jgi:hypothetical protein
VITGIVVHLHASLRRWQLCIHRHSVGASPYTVTIAAHRYQSLDDERKGNIAATMLKCTTIEAMSHRYNDA